MPLDSWIYPALDRLAALGFIPSQISGMRPWTRSECLRQVREAAKILSERDDVGAELASGIIDDLERELGAPSGGLVVESLYARAGGIAGAVLNDSFHFGQTWRNDLGRPFGQGFNRLLGSTGRFGYGRLFGHWRAEYQGAPGRAEYSDPVRETLARLDSNPVSAVTGLAPVNRARLVEGEIGIQTSILTISVGRQELYWGPGEQSPLSFSSNAEPTENLKIATNGFRLPGILDRLGTVRLEFVAGKLGGQSYTWRPWFNAQKISLKVSENLELGFTRWSLLFGVGHAMTFGNLFHNFFSVTSGRSEPFDPNDPGDRKGGFDFRWRVPGARQWLTLYSDSYSDDDPSPLAAPRRAAISPGLWLTRVPWIPKLDIRLESASTNPFSGDYGGQFNYYNNQYHSGNTNYGFLLGNPVGRDGRAYEARADYWWTPRDYLEGGFRQTKISGAFLPGGGTQSDAFGRTAMRLRPDWVLTGTVQYERFRIPLLGGPRSDWSGTVQIAWQPDGGFSAGRHGKTVVNP